MSSNELRLFSFHGDEIATLQHDGKPVVAMRRIVENMGLNWAGQHSKLLEMKQKFTCMDIHTTGSDGKSYKMLCMPVDKLPLWLASINPNKISNPAIRTKVELYQSESAIALHDYWTKGAAVRGDSEGLITAVDPGVMRALGGMMKGILAKQLAEIDQRIERIEAAHVAPTFDYASTITSSQIIEMAGILQGQRVRGTSNLVTCAMLNFCSGIGCVKVAADLNPARPWRFPTEKAREWLFGSHLGAEQIRNQIARRQRAKQKSGQSAFKLVPPVDHTVV